MSIRFAALAFAGLLTSASLPAFCGTAHADTVTAEVREEMPAGRIEALLTSFSEVKNFTEIGNNTYRMEVDGLKMIIFNKGATMQMYAAFTDDVSMSSINEWNRTKRFAKAYLDKDNDPVLEHDIELTGGVTEANVKEWFKTYVLCLKGFRDHLAQ